MEKKQKIDQTASTRNVRNCLHFYFTGLEYNIFDWDKNNVAVIIYE